VLERRGLRPEAKPSTVLGDWLDDAACKGSESEIWFLEANHKAEDEWKIFAAKEICATCPVREPCLEHAIEYREWGIWGGTTDQERKRIRMHRRRYPGQGELAV